MNEIAKDVESLREKADEKRYRDFVDRCNRITDRDIEENEFRRFVNAKQKAE